MKVRSEIMELLSYEFPILRGRLLKKAENIDFLMGI